MKENIGDCVYCGKSHYKGDDYTQIRLDIFCISCFEIVKKKLEDDVKIRRKRR